MIPGNLSLYLGALAGAAATFALGAGYIKLVHDPALVQITTVRVQAEARANTLRAIEEVNDAAEKARAMRRYCIDSGMQFDFGSGKCRDR